MKEGKNETKIINVWLMKADGTEEMLKPDAYKVYHVYHGCEYEVISTRKQFVHTVEFDGLWAELNLFSDDIPLKLKNYKGIRLELAEMPKYDTCHLKVYGDGEKNTDDIGLTGTSTTIIFNPEIFSSEINRVTLLTKCQTLCDAGGSQIVPTPTYIEQTLNTAPHIGLGSDERGYGHSPRI